MFTKEKGNIIFLICCILVTASVIFHVITSYFQRSNIVRELDWIQRELSGIDAGLYSISRELR